LILLGLGYHEKQNSINFILQATGKSYKFYNAEDKFVELLKDNMNSQMGGLLLTSPLTS